MSGTVNNAQNNQQWSFTRLLMFVRRRLKLNRFLLVIDTKKGVTISAITLIVVDLIDLLWHLSMTFGPLNPTMTSLLLLETFLVVCISSALLYSMKTENKSDLRSILFTWLVVVAVDYCLRAILNLSALFISEKPILPILFLVGSCTSTRYGTSRNNDAELTLHDGLVLLAIYRPHNQYVNPKASTTAKAMKSIESIIMLVLIAHCWLCVFTYYEDNNGKITTVKITPSDDKGRLQFNKRQLIMMKSPAQAELSPANLERSEAFGGVGAAANMLCAPTEEISKSRW